jgi:hypothetical protein
LEKGESIKMKKRMIAGLVILCVGLAQAKLVYKADFESYTEGQSVTRNTTGSNDTFSSVVNATTFNAFNGSSVGMVDGLSLKTTKATTGNVTTVQSYLGQQSSFVLSFDFYSPDQSITVGMLRDGSGGSAITFGADSGTTLDNKLVRITAVANYSGSSITLPSTSLGVGGVLANAGYIEYYKIGETYTQITYNKNTNYSNASGFRLVTPFDATPGAYTLVDNLGVWDAFTDTVAGTSVLALDFGTAPSDNGIGYLMVGAL